MNNNKIIIYFSYTGNTRLIANKIQDKLNCDIAEITTKVPYSTDYDTVVNDNHNSEASNYLPEINPLNVDLSKYDTIILGTPTWWYRPAPAIRTFLTQNNLSGKTIIPFSTNAGWLGRTFVEIKKLCPNSNIINEKNIEFESYTSNLKTPSSEIEEWIATL